ncbi:MAG TPA: prolipoprotein diacylglyceryl transferase family protein [Tepidisphaeraceae bacterium]
MTFPVQIDIFGRSIPAHPIFELAAYVVGMQSYLLLRRTRSQGVEAEHSLWIIVACVFGALIGSKLLALLESFDAYRQAADPRALLGGKTIVGGLLGGWAGVELAKRFLGVQRRTGDAYVLPLVLGIAIGRVGCFLTGLPDHTYGIASTLPWAVDFGDGIPRHPTQLYEISIVLLLGISIWLRSRRPYAEGELFRWFMLGYFGYRFLVEFIKPREIRYAGLSAIQYACLVGVGASWYGLQACRRGR